jgi:hypothetical protein
VNSVGRENFDWIVNEVAELAVRKALSDEHPAKDYRWSSFLNGAQPATKNRPKASVKSKSEPKVQAVGRQ